MNLMPKKIDDYRLVSWADALHDVINIYIYYNN